MPRSEINSYSFHPIDARMYMLTENQKTLIVDPCESEDAMEKLYKEKVEEVTVFLTHEHYDHISGVNWLREHFDKVTVYCSEYCSKAIPKPNKNLSAYCEILFGSITEADSIKMSPYSCVADCIVRDGEEIVWEMHRLKIKETPGHSKGSICILMDDVILFSGDTLVTGHDTVLRWPGGSKRDFSETTLPWLKSLDTSLLVYPGHGERQSLAEYTF